MTVYKVWKLSYKIYGVEDEQPIDEEMGTIEIGKRTPTYGNMIVINDGMLVADGTTGMVAEYVARNITETINKIKEDLMQ